MELTLFTKWKFNQLDPIWREDDLPLFVPPPVIDQEEGWLNPVVTNRLPSLPNISYIDDEIGSSLKNFYLEQEEPWNTQIQNIQWLSRSFLDDDLYPLPPPLTLGIDLVDPGITSVINTPWNNTTFLDDDIIPEIRIEQEEGLFSQTLQTQFIPWLSRVFTDDEVEVFKISIDVEPYELLYLTPQSIPWNPRPFIDDEISTNLTNFYLDYHEYLAPQFTEIPWFAKSFTDDDIWSFEGSIVILDNGGPVFNSTYAMGNRSFNPNSSTSNRVYTKSGNYNQPIQDFN